MGSGVIERPAEFRAVTKFLLSAEQEPAALIIEGEAGVGKTTLWLAGVTEAQQRGFRVLSGRAGQSETALSYAAVADLLRHVEPAFLDDLPALQRLAVDRVLLRAEADGPPTDQGVVAAAFGSVIDRLSAQAPVLLGLDDLQWLDPSSQAVVALAAMRFTGRVGVLATERSNHEGPGAASWLRLAGDTAVQRVRVGPLSLGGLHALITTRLGRTFPRPTMVRIAEISGGNPFYALELARAIAVGGSESGLPATLAELMRQRIGRLDPETQVLLLAAACAAAPTVPLLAEVTDHSIKRTQELLAEAKDKGIIAIDGEDVHFTHPLLARSVYTDATPRERRAMHRSLADTVPFPESRARHMALAASSADPTTLEALDLAADTARGRGAPAAAGELLELAIRLAGDTPARRIRAAEHYLHAGDLQRAHTLLDGVIDRVPLGVHRAVALNLLATMQIHHNNFTGAVALLEEALQNDHGNREVRVRSLLWLAYARINAGEFVRAMQSAERAAAYAEDVGDPDLTSQVLAVRSTVACICGHGVEWASIRRALTLHDPHSEAPIAFRAPLNHALLLALVGRLDEASAQMAEVRRRCVVRGAETDLIFSAVFTASIEIWRGRYDEAARVADDTYERARQLGGEHMRVIAKAVKSSVAAYAGKEDETRSVAGAAIELADRCSFPRLGDWASINLGFLEVSLGNHEQALQALQPLIDGFRFVPGTEIVTAGFVPDAVEAMIALNRAADAEPMIEALETNGRMVDRPWMLAMGARCRSLWLASRGDVEAAVEMAERALAHHDRLPMPFERARTLLLLGQLRRRQRQKERSRSALSEALQTFEQLGTPLWAQRARAELARSRTASGGNFGLTASEQRVAELAASGMTTKEIAAALFISPKTVETNLSRIYRKLGIKSRAELGRLAQEGL